MDLIPCLPDEIARECLIRVPYNQFSTLSAVSKGWKEEVESVQFHQQRKAGGLSRAIVALTQAEQNRASPALKYPATPAYRLTLFEPATGSWSSLPPAPGFPDGLPLFCQCAGVGRNLVVIGGWNPTTWEVSKAVFVFDFMSGKWRRGADMPGGSRSFFACASDSDRKVFVAGGHDDEKNALNSAMSYDLAKDEWAPLPDMERQRDECKGIFHAGKFHVIGGYSTDMQGRFERSAEVFDVATWQWSKVEEDVLDTGSCPRTCVAGTEGKFYRCKAGHVAVLEGVMWRSVAELPADIRLSPNLLTWQGNLLVLGMAKYGGPYATYVLESPNYTWRKVETPEEYSGHVQAGCCLEM
ncbi:PREDICTED: F-box/kelch-repeat protein At1g15670-like [Nelumbo nucifera]|uniref:F-box/kelch-repeat protein At1g15670-like n=2 Tax=Nelumbo nucifera TaxID=4432 RepID=A0A1U7ZCC1_NELNU|nr:PREDICTED: F-box/kelch-repeat protein At1g15670-like [Nelumbo nucifera]DAD44762.1 TPA_asm: hypothetical protein HUJ06_002992 [Nelumbo nucifera]